MSHSKVYLPIETYFEHLKTAEGITAREMEIIAFLLYDRKVDIPKYLNLQKRGVNTHIFNITQRIKNRGFYGNAQNKIAKYIESLDQASLIKGEYYQQLGIRVKFEELLLKEIPKNKYKPSCLLVCCPPDEKKGFIAKQIKEHFDLLKLRAKLIGIDPQKSITDTIDEWGGNHFDYFIFIGPLSWLKESAYFQSSITNELSPVVFLSLDNQFFEMIGGEKKNITHISFQGNYYSFFVAILKHLFPDTFFDELIEASKNPYSLLTEEWNPGFCQQKKSLEKQEVEKAHWIRSELIIPVESSLLHRPELIFEMDEKFKKQDGIQAIALIGREGAGKTTLARQYARQQKINVIWEINAETSKTLQKTFETLAQAFSKTEQDQKILREIQEITNPVEREERIILFVKEHLKLHSNWLLLFDNVEKFTSIQKYYPKDSVIWGQGKVILIAKSDNIKNNTHINSIIQVRELTFTQKFDLFTKIVFNDSLQPLISSKIQEISTFLENIPSFPLDVSIAAYYLKTTNISYAAYLKKNRSYFAKIQKYIIKKVRGYIKRCYGIVNIIFILCALCAAIFYIFDFTKIKEKKSLEGNLQKLVPVTPATNISSLRQIKKNLITWNIPRQDLIFVGREKLLEDLHEKLDPNKKLETTNALAISACAGLGGIGKTQLALQYIHHTKHSYTLKAWFPAEEIDSLYRYYIEFAKTLGYIGEKPDKEHVIAYIKKWLNEHPGWLLVYDNVNNYSEIKTFLPDKGGHVILTTRQRYWPPNFKIVPIDVMTEKESIKTIKSFLQKNIQKEKSEAKELVKILGYLPLALAQAGAYMRQNQLSITEYLKLYKSYEMELLADNTLPKEVNIYPVAITWNISLKAIIKETKNIQEGPIAIELLTVCSYLAPEKISRKILLHWLQEVHPELKPAELILNKHIGLLWKYSMINYDDVHLSIHRLVQIVLRHQLQQALENKSSICSTLNLKWYESLLRFFIDNENDFKLTSSFKQLLETREKFKFRFKNQYNDNLAELDLIISPVYYNQERYDDFLRILNNVNQYLQKRKGLEFLKCKLLYLYSAYYRKIGDYNGSEKKINESIIVFEKIKKSNHIKDRELNNLKAKILYNKANLYLIKNKTKVEADKDIQEIKNSIKLIKESISIFKKINNTRDWLRAIELHGRILILLKEGYAVLNEFEKYNNLIEEIADDRTKMLFYITYSDAYLLNGNFRESFEYCQKAKQKAKELGVKNELNNIINKEKMIKAHQESSLKDSSAT